MAGDGPKEKSKLVLVTAMTPTSHGEGKTVTSIGLSMALEASGYRSIACIRQPSLGPVFGVKGGGAGGGRASLEPMQEINMRFTGDIDAVGAAHNLLSAMIDNHIYHGNELALDPAAISWPRALDMNDRALREVVVGFEPRDSTPHRSSFVITAASEVMAILCLSKDYADLKKRLANVLVGYSRGGAARCARDLKAVGAMAALLRDAMLPNLAQTSEGTPALVHGGPFGNIAHGTCSLASMRLGQQVADFIVVEAGFGSDLGAEKFVDIVCRVGNLHIDAAVIVASVRALRYHGQAPGKESIMDVDALRRGLENLGKHIENVKMLGLRAVVAINKFPDDSQEELRAVADYCSGAGVPCAVSTSFSEGSSGAADLAALVVEASRKGSTFAPVYSLDAVTKEKIERIVTRVYGGKSVAYTSRAEKELRSIPELGFDGRPICMSKTSSSLSDDPLKLGRPRDFTVTVRSVEPAAGAGFNIVHLGDVVTMPGLPKVPAAEKIELSDDGVITGVQ